MQWRNVDMWRPTAAVSHGQNGAPLSAIFAYLKQIFWIWRPFFGWRPPAEPGSPGPLLRHCLKLVQFHFPKQHPFHKLFNRNTIKVSYSCMPNLDALVSSQNKSKLQKDADAEQKIQQERQCNCRDKSRCPLENRCLTKTVVYQATIHHDNKQAKYIGMTENEFKTRYNNHMQNIRTDADKHRTATELSKYIWNLKDNNIDYKLTWEILQRTRPYKGGMMKCNLCTTEKYYILMNNDLINKKKELLNKCPHRRKFIIQHARI